MRTSASLSNKLLKMTKFQIEENIREVYENEGQASACDEANKYPEVTYKFCPACDALCPSFPDEEYCLLCGTTTTKDPHMEDIPFENFYDDEY